MLTAYVIANIITAICNLSLALLVYFKDKKNIVNINYFLLNTSVALWAFGFAMAITASDKTHGAVLDQAFKHRRNFNSAVLPPFRFFPN